LTKLRRDSAFAHRAIAVRSAGSRGNLSRFHKSRKLRRRNILRMQAGAQGYRLHRGAKAETFEALNLPRRRKKCKAQEGAQLLLDQLERTRSGPLNLFQEAGGECTGERDMGHQIYAWTDSHRSRRRCKRFNHRICKGKSLDLTQSPKRIMTIQ
jgi:hypothetical protein